MASLTELRNAWSNALAVPNERLQPEHPLALYDDEQFELYMQQLCAEPLLNSFREYIGLKMSRQESCCETKECIPAFTCDGPLPRPMLNPTFCSTMPGNSRLS